MRLHVLLVILMTAAVTAVGAAPDRFQISPNEGFGPFRAGMTAPQVERLVKAEEIGDGQDGALTVYFLDPKKRVTMVFDANGKVRTMAIHGLESVWHTRDGITLGTPLQTLMRLNGAPLKFHAFDGSELAGRVLGWGGGRLERSLAHVRMTFASPMHARGYNGLTGPEKEAVEASGRVFSSSEGTARRLDPVLEDIQLQL